MDTSNSQSVEAGNKLKPYLEYLSFSPLSQLLNDGKFKISEWVECTIWLSHVRLPGTLELGERVRRIPVKQRTTIIPGTNLIRKFVSEDLILVLERSGGDHLRWYHMTTVFAPANSNTQRIFYSRQCDVHDLWRNSHLQDAIPPEYWTSTFWYHVADWVEDSIAPRRRALNKLLKLKHETPQREILPSM